MEPTPVKEELLAVLRQIQADSGLDCPSLTGTTKPVENLPEFDSVVWPIATSILADKIGMTIPDDVNIFINDLTKAPHTIDEATYVICNLLKRQSDREVG